MDFAAAQEGGCKGQGCSASEPIAQSRIMVHRPRCEFPLQKYVRLPAPEVEFWKQP